VHLRPQQKSKLLQCTWQGKYASTQTTPSTHITVAVQCSLLKPSDDLSNDCEAHDDDVAFVDDPRDINYEPTAANTSKTQPKQKKTVSSGRSDILTERKFVVFESCLLQLFLICHACFSVGCSAAVSAVIGTMVIIRQKCDLCGETTSWNSQPYIRAIPAGNLLLSPAILFAGALPRKTLRVFEVMKLAVFQPSTYFRHQKQVLVPIVCSVWNRHQQDLVSNLSQVTVAGDARCDSIGHCAKFGSYTLIDLNEKKVIALELVQSNEVGGSYHMELAWLQRC
jgi:hypothetical protein